MIIRKITPEIKKSIEAYIKATNVLDELTDKYGNSERLGATGLGATSLGVTQCSVIARGIKCKVKMLNDMLTNMMTPIFEFFGIPKDINYDEESMEVFMDILYSNNSIDDICKDLIELGKRWD